MWLMRVLQCFSGWTCVGWWDETEHKCFNHVYGAPLLIFHFLAWFYILVWNTHIPLAISFIHWSSGASTAKLPNGEHFMFGNKVEPTDLFFVVQVKVIQRVEALVHPPLVAGHPALDGDALRSWIQHKLLQVVKLNLRRWRSLLAEWEQRLNTNSRQLRTQK